MTILSADTGAGHRSVARAVAAELDLLSGGTVQARVIDAFGASDSPSLLGQAAAQGYGTTIVHAPALWGRLYGATDHRWLLQAVAAGPARWAVRRMERLLRQAHPDLIVAVHPLALWLAAHAQDLPRGVSAAPVPLWSVVTDLVSIHAAWVQPAVERYFVGCAEGATRLIARGVSAEVITVSGLPIGRTFTALNQAAAHPSPPHPRTVLVMGGGDGAGNLVAVVRAIIRAGLGVRVIAVCGRNRQAYRALQAERVQCPTLCVVGVVADVAFLMARADVVVTKAGSVTIAEAAAAGRPLIISAVLPGQEAGNRALVTGHSAGLVAATPERVVAALRLLQRDPARLVTLARGCHQLGQPHAARTVAQSILERVASAARFTGGQRGAWEGRG